MLDDAAGIPPIENMKLYARMGCDLYCFSGGKGLCGPQCTGLLFGRKDLIDAAIANYSPWEGAVCRPMKVGKEEIMGALAAVEGWLKRDLNALDKEWNERARPHSEARRYGARRQDRDRDSQGWQPVSDGRGELG